MAVNPNVLNLGYKQLTEEYLGQTTNYIEPFPRPGEIYRNIIADGKPSYLNIYKQSDGEARAVVNADVRNMAPGLYVSNMILFMRIQEDAPGRPGEVTVRDVNLGTLEVRLTVLATVRLSVSPSPAVFNYTLEGIAPSPMTITVQSESTWTVTKTKTWTSLSTSTGFGVGSFAISVQPIGLAVGTHTDTLTIVDDRFSVTLLVTLTITEADTEDTFLFVQPSAMTVNYTVGGYLPIRQVELNASGNWTATASEPWMALDRLSGFPGVAFLNFTINEAVASALSAGSYIGTLIFEQGGLVKTIYITLNVYQLVESLLNDEDLYFTDDDNKIILSSLREDTFLAIELSSSFENNIDIGKFAIPFYAGRGERRIGNFPKKVIGHRPLPIDLFTPALFAPYANALINMIITEEDVLSDQVYQAVPVENVRFIKGSTPGGGWLSEMPAVRFMTRKGIAAFSFLSNNNTASQITVSGSVNAVFPMSPAPNPFYSCILPMQELADLEVGNEIDITVLDQTLKLFISPDGKDHALIFWENQWGCFDVFETTGDVEVEADFNASKFKFRKDYRLSETKTLSIETGNSFQIDTGWVRSADEILGLQNLLKATNVYIFYDGKISKVNNSTKKLQISETDREEPSFTLTFDNAIS